MKKGISIAAIAAALLAAPSAAVLAQSQVTVTTDTGGPMEITLLTGHVVNYGSTLQRQWATVHDSRMPVDLKGTQCLKAAFNSGRGDGEFQYGSQYSVTASAPVAAFEVRFLAFDVFGNFVRTMTATKVVDLAAGAEQSFNSIWRIPSENEASEHFACLAFVAKARTAAGVVHEYDTAAVLKAARQFSKRFTEADLEPERAKLRP